MGKIVSAYIMPHAPILISEVGKSNTQIVEDTVLACEKIAKDIADHRPETIIISSPHAPCFRDFGLILDKIDLKGDFRDFGVLEISFSIQNDIPLAKSISRISSNYDINAGFPDQNEKEQLGFSSKLDHGVMVPLYFIEKEMKRKNQNFKLIVLSTPFMELEDLYKYGRAINEAVRESGKRVVYVASGDLSHRLKKGSPAGFSPYGKEYDEKIIEIVKNTDIKSLLSISQSSMQEAGECGTRSFVMMFGALYGYNISSEIFSYEGPFGVGYLTAKILKQIKYSDFDDDEKSSEYVRLAKYSLENYVKHEKIVDIPNWISTDMLKLENSCFVSLHKGGMLRGCIGTITPSKKNLALEIIYNSVSAGTKDPRFSRVEEIELGELEYKVDVLENFEKIDSMDQLDVKRYGVIVSKGFRSGLLLPDLDGVNNAQEQVYIALQKAGISPGEDYKMQRFEVTRYT